MAEEDHNIDGLLSTRSQSRPAPSPSLPQQQGLSSQIPFKGSHSDQQMPGKGSNVKQTAQHSLPIRAISTQDANQKFWEVERKTSEEWQKEQEMKMQWLMEQEEVERRVMKRRVMKRRERARRVMERGERERQEMKRRERERQEMKRRERERQEMKRQEMEMQEMKRQREEWRERPIQGIIELLLKVSSIPLLPLTGLATATDWTYRSEKGKQPSMENSGNAIAQEDWKDAAISEDQSEAKRDKQPNLQYGTPLSPANSWSSLFKRWTSQPWPNPAGTLTKSSPDNKSSAKSTKSSKDFVQSTIPSGEIPGRPSQARASNSSSTVAILERELLEVDLAEAVSAALPKKDPLDLENSPSASSIASPQSDGEVSFINTNDVDHGSFADNPDIGSNLLEIQSMLVARIVRKYLQAAADCGFRGTAQLASRASSGSIMEAPSRLTSAAATLQSSISRGKRARADDGDDDGSNRRKKSSQQQKPHSDSSHFLEKLFACPFAKYDLHRYSERNMVEKNYRGCSSCFLKDISRVKQHLYRVHKRPDHYCGSCFLIFETQEDLDNHSRQRPACVLAEARFSEKMTRDQLNSIKRRSVGKDACETWFNIFRILFPGAPVPDSPYCEAASPAAVETFSERFLARAPTMLSALVRDRIQGYVLITDYEEQILYNALEDSLSEVVQHFAAGFDEVEATLTAQAAAVSDPTVPLPRGWETCPDSNESAAHSNGPPRPQMAAVRSQAGPLPSIWEIRPDGHESAAQSNAPIRSQTISAPGSTSGDWDDLFVDWEDDPADEAHE